MQKTGDGGGIEVNMQEQSAVFYSEKLEISRVPKAKLLV